MMYSRNTASWQHSTEMQQKTITTKTTKPKRSGQSTQTTTVVVKGKKPKQQNQKPRSRPKSDWAPSDCVKKYTLALADPRDPRATGACIPTFPSPPSQKVKFEAETTFTIGTQGDGFFYWAPSGANDASQVWKSSSTYASTGVVATATGTVQSAFAGLPYTTTQVTGTGSVNPDVKYRLVAICAEEMYIGTELNKSGVRYHLHEPNHNIPQTLAISNLSAYPTADTYAVSRQPRMVNGFSVTPEETEYGTYSENGTSAANGDYKYPWAGGMIDSNSVPVGSIVIAVSGGVAGMTHHVRLTMLIEYIGAPARMLVTPSHADSAGFEIAAAASQLAQNDTSGRSFKAAFADELSKAATAALPHVSRAASNAAFAYMRGSGSARSRLDRLEL